MKKPELINPDNYLNVDEPAKKAVEIAQAGKEWAHYIRIYGALIASPKWVRHYRLYERAIDRAGQEYNRIFSQVHEVLRTPYWRIK